MSKTLDFLPKQAAPKKLSKEEKLDVKRQQTLVKEVIYPILLKYAKSIKNAKTILNTLVVGMDSIFMMDMQEWTKKRSGDALHTLPLKQSMNIGKEYMAEWELVEALKDEKIMTAKALIDGMDKELQRLLDKELLERPLEDLKTEFI